MKLSLKLHELTSKQQRIINSQSDHLIIEGPAGTAKTYTAVARGLRLYNQGDVDRILVIRSPVEIRKIGYLPGDHAEKVDVYAAPYIDMINTISVKHNYRALLNQGIVDFQPTSYLRGQTFDDTYIIADEFQNFSAHEFETIITRVGVNSHLIVVGDEWGQSDLERHEYGQFRMVLDTLRRMEEFEEHNFDTDDILRSGLVKSYYEARGAGAQGSPVRSVQPLPDSTGARSPSYEVLERQSA